MAQLKDLLVTGAARVLNGIYGDLNGNILNYGECATAEATNAKTVTTNGTFELKTGSEVAIRFINGNSASSPTLNVNGLGAKNIYIGAAAAPAAAIQKGTYLFRYDGTNWQLIGSSVATRIGTAEIGSTDTPIYIKSGGIPTVISHYLRSNVSTGTKNRLAYYSASDTLSQTTNVEVLLATNTVTASVTTSTAAITGLRIWGPTYGNNAINLTSTADGVIRYGDGGPQIQFDSSETGSQAGALIFTDNDDAGTGASFHFVTNQNNDDTGGDLTVTAPRFRARKGLTIGSNSDDTGYTLSVNGNQGITGSIYPTSSNQYYLGDLSNYWDGAYINGNGNIHWNNLVKLNNTTVVSTDVNRGLPRILSNFSDAIASPGNKLFGLSKESIAIEYTTDGWATSTVWSNSNSDIDAHERRTFTNGVWASTASVAKVGNLANAAENSSCTPNIGYGTRLILDFQKENRKGWIECLVVGFYTRGHTAEAKIERWNKNNNTWTEIYKESLNNFNGRKIIYPEKSFYMNGNASTDNAPVYCNILRISLTLTDLGTLNQYAPSIGGIAAFGREGVVHTRNTGYLVGKRSDIAIAQYGLPFSFVDRASTTNSMLAFGQYWQFYGDGSIFSTNQENFADVWIGNSDQRSTAINTANYHAEGRLNIYDEENIYTRVKNTSYTNLVNGIASTSRDFYIPRLFVDGTIVPFYSTSIAYDVNDIVDLGFYSNTGTSMVNGPIPSNKRGQFITIPYTKASANTSPNFASQIYIHGYDTGSNQMFFRTSTASSWNPWQSIIHMAANTQIGTNNQPVYISSAGEALASTYIQNRLYYSASTSSFEPTEHYADTTHIAINSTALYSDYNLYVQGPTKINEGNLDIYPVGGNYNDGIRIHARSSDGAWCGILFCSSALTSDTETDDNSWVVGNQNGNFYITKNGVTSGTTYLANTSNSWAFYPRVGVNGQNTSYNFYVNGTSNLAGNITTSGILSVTNATDSTSTSSGALIVTGGVGIGKQLYVNSSATIKGSTNISGALTVNSSANITGATTIGDVLTVNSSATINGPIRIGAADSTATTGYGVNNVGSKNYIAFYGTAADGAGSYNHTYIGESMYGAKTSTSIETSELLLFKGNDRAASAGPDRIRLLAGEVEIQTYSSGLAGTWNDIRTSTVATRIMNLSSGTITANASIVPATTNARTLGTSSLYWSDAYLNTIHSLYLDLQHITVRHIDAALPATHADGVLYIGYGMRAPSKETRFYTSTSTSGRTEWFRINANGAYALTRFGVNGQNTSYNFYVNGSSLFKNHVIINYDKPHFTVQDPSTATDTYAMIRLGNKNTVDGVQMYLNGPSRTSDGGQNVFTIRNRVGNIRINSNTDFENVWSRFRRSSYDLGPIVFSSIGNWTNTSTGTTRNTSIAGDWGYLYFFSPRIQRNYATATATTASATTIPAHGYFAFRAFSYNGSTGAKLDYLEEYKLPPVDKDRTSHGWYTIATNKNPGIFYWANVQCTTSANKSAVPTFAAIELSAGSPYVDFHYNNSTADYTSRIIENASGRLYIPGKLAVAYTNDSYNLSCNSLAVNGNLFVNASNTSGRGIILSDDGDIVDLNNGYCSMRFSSGVQIYSANKGGSPNIELMSNGIQYNHSRTWGNKPSSGTTFFEAYQWWDQNNARRGAVGSGFTSDGWAFTHIQHQRKINNAETYTQLYLRIHDNGSRKIDVSAPMYGAVWNDYAEFRKGQMDNLKPGQVVTEVGNGEMKLANQKLQKGCKILSDTFGFALGETKECKLPIAVSGRVLVYCDTPKEELEPGDCLCANYNGNAIKMTGEEIIKYPDRIIGTVSEIPDYEIWHGGEYRPEIKNNPEDIVVNGRIWVYVR